MAARLARAGVDRVVVLEAGPDLGHEHYRSTLNDEEALRRWLEPESDPAFHRPYTSVGSGYTGVMFLSGRAIDLALVARALRAHGADPLDLPLDEITVMGALDEGMRQFLTRAFGVGLRERFSSSEIFGGAVRAIGAAEFRTDPFVVAQATDPAGRVLDRGLGRLTMTELYPFVQVQPLIRYVTGDLVQQVGSPGPGRVSFHWMGRLERCPTLHRPGGTDLVLPYRPVADAVGELPAVARRQESSAGPAPFGTVGMPVLDLVADIDHRAHVRVGTVVDPFLHPAAAQEVVDAVWAALRPWGAPGGRDSGVELVVELLPGDADARGAPVDPVYPAALRTVPGALSRPPVRIG